MNGKVIILAGGKGTRMNGADIPKVLIDVKGKPMIEYVLLALETKPIVVVGYQADKVKTLLGDRVEYVLQEEQLGTGHAVSCAKESLIDFDGPIIVLYGDQPLLKAKTISRLFKLYEENKANVSMLTTIVQDFSGWRKGFNSFGRILRDESGNIKAIREMKDCSEEEKNVKEVNPGYYCFDSQWLWKNIDKLQSKNNQNEYYLTDLIEIAVEQQELIPTDSIQSEECLGVNTSEQLKLVEEFIS